MVSRVLGVVALLLGVAPVHATPLTVPQGGVARWAGLGADSCQIYGKRYPAVAGACYYPIDIRARAGRRTIALWDASGQKHLASLEVRPTQFPDVTIELPPALARYIDVSAEDRALAQREGAELARALVAEPTPPRFSLPLGKPAATLPRSQADFGSERSFGGKSKSLHTGRDYPVSVHTPVKAIAAGRVLLATDHFYTGKAVYIDHGAGLVSMNFHLGSVSVKAGDTVKRGQTIGKVGATGRATGPHLHLGVRWLGKRVDPALLLAPPSKLPSVSDTKDEAEQKILEAETREPPETNVLFEAED